MTYLSSPNPCRLIADSDRAGALLELPSWSPSPRPPTEGGLPPRSGPCSRRRCPQFGPSTFFGTSPFALCPARNIHIVQWTSKQYICILVECRTTHLNFVDEPLGSALYPCRLLGLGELFVTNEVVPTLAPHVNVLATIMGAPLDLLHFVVGGRLGLLARRATPSRGSGYQRTLTLTRGALWRRSLCPGWSLDFPLFSWRGSRGFCLPRPRHCSGEVSLQPLLPLSGWSPRSSLAPGPPRQSPPWLQPWATPRSAPGRSAWRCFQQQPPA